MEFNSISVNDIIKKKRDEIKNEIEIHMLIKNWVFKKNPLTSLNFNILAIY